MQTAPAQYPTYWEIKSESIILKRLSDTLVNQIQVKGNDLKNDFYHNWEKVTFPSKDVLDGYLLENAFIASSIESYDRMLCEYFQINEIKRSFYNQDRQRRYDEGSLKL